MSRYVNHLIVLSCLINLDITARAEDKALFAMSIAEFRQLSLVDQEKLLVSVFEHRLEHAKNIYYEIEVRTGNHEYHNDRVGKLLTATGDENYRHWRLGDSYRMDIERRDPNVKPDQFILNQFILTTVFDSANGVVKSILRFSDDDRIIGRIDVVHDPLTEENRYAYWLDGKHIPMGDYLIRYIVEQKGKYKISFDGDMVRLTIPWAPALCGEPSGTRTFDLDPQKGFLPMHGKAHWESKAPNGKSLWRTEKFVVEDSQLVGDVFMPTKLRELICGSSGGADTVSVLETKVTKIEAGTVKPKDLEITFPKGTEVIDVIKGLSYTVGSNGEPTNVERIVGARPEFTPPKPPQRKRNTVSILIGTGLLIIVAILIAWKIIGKKRAKVEN